MKQTNFIATLQKVPQGYIGWVEELPGVNTQGKTKKEVIENLKEAIVLVGEANKKLAANSARGNVSTQTIQVTLTA